MRGRLDFTGTAEDLARLFHDTYRAVSPPFMVPGSSVPAWEGCKPWYRGLLIATCAALLFGEEPLPDRDDARSEDEAKRSLSPASPRDP